MENAADPETCAPVTPRIRLVAESAHLGALLEELDSSPDLAIAVDTEADSFHHYFEKVCLLQLSWGGSAFLVDPLAGFDLAPLFERLSARPLLLHGADYDLRLLSRRYGFRPASVFDTMLAAQLLGEKEIGLAALLKARLGVELDKSSQRDDWSERPLTPVRVAYAAADVLHLHGLVDALEADLRAAGRRAWHEEECARLVATNFTPRAGDPENDWRVKGTNGLTDRERAFVRAFWWVRDARARLLDRPPFRILTNDRLLAAAKAAASGTTDPLLLFRSTRPLPPPLLRDLGEAAREAAALDPPEWPGRRRRETAPVDPVLEREVEALRKRRDADAVRLGLDPSVLAPRATLAAAARVRLDTGRLVAAELVERTGISCWRAELLAGA